MRLTFQKICIIHAFLASQVLYVSPFSEICVFNWQRLERDLQFSSYKRLVPLISTSIAASKGKQRWTDGQGEIDSHRNRNGQSWTEARIGRHGRKTKKETQKQTGGKKERQRERQIVIEINRQIRRKNIKRDEQTHAKRQTNCKIGTQEKKGKKERWTETAVRNRKRGGDRNMEKIDEGESQRKRKEYRERDSKQRKLKNQREMDRN